MDGFTHIEWSGLWNMPSRKGETTYDWGDEIEPLVDDEDIVWNSREFKLKAFFDKRIKGADFDKKKKELKKKTRMTLSTPFRDCKVWLNSFRVISENSIGVVCEFEFYEDESVFEAEMPIASGVGSTIDGYSLYNDLGIYFTIKKDKELTDLKSSKKTVFNRGVAKSHYRELPELTLECFSKDVKPIQKILSSNGLRELQHEGSIYKCFFTKGFKVVRKGNGFKYRIELNVYDII